MIVKSGPLKVIGQFNSNNIGWKTHVKFVSSHWSVLVSVVYIIYYAIKHVGQNRF